MTTNKQRLAAAARETGIDQASAAPANLESLLDRLEQTLAWPAWETRPQSPSPGATATAAVSVKHEPATVDTLKEKIKTALAQARPAAVGGAYTFIADADSALAAALHAGQDGPLGGVTFAVKDLVAVAGQPLRAGSAVREKAPPELSDAPVVALLRQAGAIFVGTTSLHEIAFGVTGINDYAGTPLNPHDPTRIPGGSSSGSAVAVAEGSADVAIGTDTGGSVRIPAALCGVVGFKPSFGAYPSEGVFPLSPTLDHVGILARSVADVQRVHALLAAPVNGHVQPRRLGLLRVELEQSQPAVQQLVQEAIDRLAGAGCLVEDVEWPDGETIFAVSTAIMFAEAAAIHRQEMRRDAMRYGADVRARLLQGLALPATDYVAARRGRQQLRHQVQARLAGVDAVIGPTVGIVAPALAQARDPAVAGRLVAFTRLANVVGLPALSLPLPGPGLPVGLQVIARDDRQALAIGLFIEHVLRNHRIGDSGQQ